MVLITYFMGTITYFPPIKQGGSKVSTRGSVLFLYAMDINSTSKVSVAEGGMTGG